MPGYELDPSDLEKIPTKYICSSCKKVLNSPVQTKCGHFYCSSCIVDLKESNHSLRCIVDQTWLSEDEIFPDKCVSREIKQLIVNCPQKLCKWRGMLRDFQNHLWSCVFILIPCMFGCGEMVKQSDMGSHHEGCKASNSDTKKEVSSPMYSSLISIWELSSLRDPSGGCLFEGIGCKTPKTLTVTQLREHNVKCLGYHISLLLKYVQKQEQNLQIMLSEKVESLTRHVTAQAEKIVHLENVTRGLWGFDAEAMLRRLINAENMNADLGVLIVELNSNIEELHKKALKSEKQQENQLRMINELKARLPDGQVPASGPSRNMVKNNQPSNLLSMTSFDGVLLWKITDVARKRNEALANRTASFCSPPFYTDHYGYKMCVRVYLNGDGMGRGQYLSLFFVLMQGEYDSLLRWPFQNKVTMMLLDQNRMEHVIDAFKPDPSSSSFKRPTNAMNVASGCPLFCPLDELNNHAYVKDDTMFIKIIVDTSDCF